MQADIFHVKRFVILVKFETRSNLKKENQFTLNKQEIINDCNPEKSVKANY
jgi:hypothetical protein